MPFDTNPAQGVTTQNLDVVTLLQYLDQLMRDSSAANMPSGATTASPMNHQAKALQTIIEKQAQQGGF